MAPIDPLNDPRRSMPGWQAPISPLPRPVHRPQKEKEALIKPMHHGETWDPVNAMRSGSNEVQQAGDPGKTIFDRESVIRFLQALVDAETRITYTDFLLAAYPGSTHQKKEEDAWVGAGGPVPSDEQRAARLINTTVPPELAVAICKPDGSYIPGVNIDEEWAAVARDWAIMPNSSGTNKISGAAVAIRWLHLASANRDLHGQFGASIKDVVDAIRTEGRTSPAVAATSAEPDPAEKITRPFRQAPLPAEPGPTGDMLYDRAYKAMQRLFRAIDERQDRLSAGEQHRSDVQVATAIREIKRVLAMRLEVDADKREAIERGIDEATKALARSGIWERNPSMFHALQKLMRTLANS